MYRCTPLLYWSPYSQDAHRQLEKAHSTLRRNAAIKLQSNIRRYLAIKKWPQVKNNLQHRIATPSPQAHGTTMQRMTNGEVGVSCYYLLKKNCFVLISHLQFHSPVTTL